MDPRPLEGHHVQGQGDVGDPIVGSDPDADPQIFPADVIAAGSPRRID
jgi:hypothetical protein